MELRELKDKILKNEKVRFPLNFVNNNSSMLLIKSYLKAIANIMHLELKEVASLEEVSEIEDNVFYDNCYLFVFMSGKDDLIDVDKISRSSLIIISEKEIEGLTAVTFNKLLEWQIEDYIKTITPGLDSTEVKWLCKICNYDVDRLTLEANKLNIFDKKEQSEVFQLINADNGYLDLNDLTIFSLTNAVIKKDTVTAKNVIKDLDNIDVEGTGLVTLLLRHFKNIISIQLNKKATAASLKMEERQFKAIQYNCNKYSDSKLIDIYEFLNSIDYRLKSGLLELSNKELVCYILAHVLN